MDIHDIQYFVKTIIIIPDHPLLFHCDFMGHLKTWFGSLGGPLTTESLVKDKCERACISWSTVESNCHLERDKPGPQFRGEQR